MNRILFIGNSHTYLHYMPQLLAGLAQLKGRKVITEQSIGEGASLAWHWKNSEARDLIQKKHGPMWCSRNAAGVPWMIEHPCIAMRFSLTRSSAIPVPEPSFL